MEALYVEGPATHNDPESCGGVREDVGEALTGAHTGRAIEPRKRQFGVPTLSIEAEGNIPSRASASCWATLRGRRT